MFLDGHSFENCTIVGPAIMWLDEATANRIEFSELHDLDKIIWEVPRTRRENKSPGFRGFCVKRMMGLEPTTFCMASEREPLRLVASSRS